MSKVSNIISSYVVSIFESKTQGVVNNLLFNNKKKAKYIIISQNDEMIHTLDTQYIYSIGNGAMIIKNQSSLELIENKELELSQCFNPINNLIVDTDGNFLGKVADIELDTNYYITKLISSTEQIIDVENILNHNGDAIVVSFREPKHKLINFRTKTTLPKASEVEDTKVSIAQDKTIPNRAITNYSFLIGRSVSQFIQNFSGEIIIKKGQVITSNIIETARVNGKIRELTKYSL